MKRIIITAAAIALMCATGLFAAEPARFIAETPDSVLFVGNSFTGGALNIYSHVQTMATLAADPDTFVSSGYIDGGKSLKYHWNLGEAQKRIRVGGWDVVVLQEFMAMPAYLDTFIYYAGKFKTLIDSVGAQACIYMTHDNQLHDITDIQMACDSVGNLYDIPVVPCGLTHEVVKAEHPYLNPLHDPFDTDGVHPGSVGRYLNICTFYSALTRKSPVSIDFNPGLYPTYNDSDLLYIQSASWDLMRDYIEGPCTDTTTAPTAPSGLNGEARTLSSLVLHWDESSSTGCGIRKYNVYRDDVYAGSAYQPAFKDTNLLGGTEYEYTVTALSLGNVESAASSPVSITTIADTILPELLNAPTTKRATQVELIFSETLDPISAETPGNYAIDNGIIVSAAELSGSGTRVSLTVSALADSVTYTVTVTGVTDNSTSKNAVAPGTQATFRYIPPIMMENCIGYYPFEMNLEDYSVNNTPATWKRDPSFTAAGYEGYGVECNGTDENSYPIIPRTNAHRVQPAFTYALWFKKAVASEAGYVLYKHTGFNVLVNATKITGNAIADTTVSFDYAAPQVNDTEWHHLAYTYDGAALRLYVDAVLLGATACTGTVTAYTGINVGNHQYVSGAQRSWYGTLDEFRMYSVALDSTSIAALYSDNTGIVAAADSVAVQEIIQQNMLITSVPVVATRDAASGRVLACDFDSMGTYRIIQEVGQLTAMRALYCAGSDDADSLLTLIDPALGTCTALETLILKDNQLTDLPDEITNLTNLTLLDVSGNMLCGLSDPVKAWLDTYDPDWADGQTGCSSVTLRYPDGRITLPLADGALLDAMGREVNQEHATSGIYLKYDAANGQMHKILIVR